MDAEEIVYFCKPCDFRCDYKACPRVEREEQIGRNSCIYAQIKGVRVTEIRKDGVMIEEKAYERLDDGDGSLDYNRWWAPGTEPKSGSKRIPGQ